MIDRKVIETIEKNLNLDEDVKEEAEFYSEKVWDYLKENNVNFDESTSMVFLNHLFALFQRLKNKEALPEMGDEVLDQIDPAALKLSKDSLKIIEEAKGVTLDTAEIVLVAIHVQNALQNNC